MSKIDEMSVQYADKQLEMADPELYATSYSRHTKMGIRVFCGSDIEEAYTDGAKAVLEEIEKLTNNQNWCAFPRQSHKELKELIEQLKEK